MVKISKLTIILLFLLVTKAFGDNDRPAQYAVWQSYGASWKHELVYPDFALRFIEEKEGLPYPGSSRKLGSTFIFEIRNEDETQTLRWSDGTGDISPIFFTVKGKDFVFEMKCSEIVKGCEEKHKVLIWERNDFNVRKNRNLP